MSKPDPKIVHSLEQPGALSKEAAFHEPVVYTRKLVQGLETTRIIKITVPHPLTLSGKTKNTPVKAIYLVDKDGIVIGYDYFTADKSEAVYETKINGIINYLEIYVECREHGIWLKKVRLN